VAEMLRRAGLGNIRRLNFTGANHTGIVAGVKG